MKQYFTCSLLVVAITGALNAQIEMDKPIQLTGSGADAKVSGIQSVTAAQDATSAEVIQKNQVTYASATSAANVYSVTLVPAPAAYTPGMAVHFAADAANTGAASLNVNGLGAVSIRKNYNVTLAANDIRSGQIVSVIYDGSTFQMVSQLGNTGGGAAPCSVGQRGEAGGVIFYCGAPFNLEAAPTDQSPSAPWGCSGTNISGTSTAVGTGQANTTLIVNGCATADIAARICDNLVTGGKSDWYLPSKDELNLMYDNRYNIGGFDTYFRWSSSQGDASNAWQQGFNNTLSQNNDQKTTGYRVRCIRSF
jgi:hypothetical protein